MTNTRKANITFNPVITLRPRGKEEVTLDLSKAPESVLGDLLITGLRVRATNAYNSGGADTPESDRRSNVERLVAAWNRGDVNAGNSGPRDSMVGDMREAFVSKQVALGKSTKEAEAMIRNAVTQAFGKDEKATFPRFLDAVATLKVADSPAKDRQHNYDTMRAELEASAIEAATKLRESRKEASEELDIDTAELF